MTETTDYASKRRHFRRQITVYGRKPVLEALDDASLECQTLHLARSNRRDGIVAQIRHAAESRGVTVKDLTREELARISRNGRQDQGVALDVLCPRARELGDYLKEPLAPRQRLIALDGVTNPQNLGMAIRSCVAADVDGILLADRGNPAPGPLVIKASAGTIFKAPLLRCTTVPEAVRQCLDAGFSLYRLQAGGAGSLFDGNFTARSLFVLGGESEGISAEVKALPGSDIAIPMAGGIESLNVAVSAALVAYAGAYFDR